MASSFTIKKYFGTAPGTATAAASFMHLVGADVDATLVNDYQSAPNQITVPSSGTNYSYEAWWTGIWGGTFNSITAVKFWKSAGTLPTGVAINAAYYATGVTTTPGSGYVSPVITASAIATAAIPTSSGTALTPTVTVVGANNNFIQWIVLQLTVGTSAPPGDVGPSTYSFQWTES